MRNDVYDVLVLAGNAMAEYLAALTKESDIRIALMLAELEEAGVKAEQAEKEAAKASGAVGMMAAPYGYCPACGEANLWRIRSPDPREPASRSGMAPLVDACPNGHRHPSSQSLIRPPKPDPPPTEVIRNDQTNIPDDKA